MIQQSGNSNDSSQLLSDEMSVRLADIEKLLFNAKRAIMPIANGERMTSISQEVLAGMALASINRAMEISRGKTNEQATN